MVKKIIKLNNKTRCIVKHKDDGVYVTFESKWFIFWFDSDMRRTLIQVTDTEPQSKNAYLFNPMRHTLWSNMTGAWDTELWDKGTVDIDARIKELCDECLKKIEARERVKQVYLCAATNKESGR